MLLRSGKDLYIADALSCLVNHNNSDEDVFLQYNAHICVVGFSDKKLMLQKIINF